MTCTWLPSLGDKATDWFRWYIVFPRASLFILGLVFSRGLVDYAVTSVLISYLTSNYWHNQNLQKAVAIVNLQEGVTIFMEILLAHISDACTGRFLTGLVLLLVGDRILEKDESPDPTLFYVAVLLIALGTAGLETPLREFLADQLRKRRTQPITDERKVDDIVNVWWRISRFSGASLATFTLSRNDIWAYKFKISVITMGVGYLLFLFAFSFYDRKREEAGSPLSLLYRVPKAAILKRRLDYTGNPSQFHKNDNNDQPPFFPQDQCLSLVEATGSTFFIEQSTNLNDQIGNRFTVSINVFFLMKSFSSFIFANLCYSLIQKFPDRRTRHHCTLVTIGFGLVSCILCCITAMQIEIRRLHLVEIAGLKDYPEKTIPMSIFWLTPQYCLLGVMEGLTEQGLQNFTNDQLTHEKPDYRIYWLGFICVLGIGKFINVAFLFIFKSWFGPTINESRLDHYYKMLVFLCVGNLLVYICVSCMYYCKKVPVEKEDSGAILGVEGGVASLEEAGTSQGEQL